MSHQHQEEIYLDTIANLRKELAFALRDKNKAEEEKKSLQSHFDMYVKAWYREMGNKVFPKSHQIDALVLTTAYHYKRSEKVDELEKNAKTNLAFIAAMREALTTVYYTLNDLKKGFHWNVQPERWVEQVQALLKPFTL